MDTVFVITQPSGFSDWNNLWTFISAIATIAAVFFAVKAYRRFEYQAVKPRQIEEVLKLMEFVNEQKYHIKSIMVKDQPCCFYFNEQRIIEGNKDNGNATELTDNLLKKRIALKLPLHDKFHNFHDNIYLPEKIVSQINKLTPNLELAPLSSDSENYIIITDLATWSYADIFWELNHPTFRSYESLSAEVKELYRLIEEWLYKQGISNLNLRYYKPRKFESIRKKIF